MFERIATGFLKKSVMKGFFTTILWCVQGICLSLITVIYKSIVFVVKAVFGILSRVMQLIDYPVDILIKHLIARTTPVQKNKIMFLTFQGDYTCNPKMIAEEIQRQGLDYELVWDVKTTIPTSDYPLGLHFVQHNTLEFYRELASARVIIENTNIVERLHALKKPDQYLFQTWHGSLGIKRLDGDVVMGLGWKHLAKICQKNVDYLLSNSDFESEVFASAYWKGVPALKVGHARNDVFFLDEAAKSRIRRKVYYNMGISEDKKIFLFAPTHRDRVNESYQALNYELIKDALQKRFGGDWQIVVRLHNRLKKESVKWLGGLPSYVSNGTLYEDMQELLVAADAGVTDYSSWIFDYVLSGKPGFIIELGLDEFKEQRGFYYPIETTPFPIAKNSKELARNISSFDAEKYAKDTARFLEERGCMEDGHASERIVEKIRGLM